MEFNKQTQIERMKPSVTKMLAQLQKKNISFSHIDTETGLENVIFTCGDKKFKMSHHSLYRYSGITVLCRDKGENQSEAEEVTDEMYLNIFMRPIIETQLSVK